MEKVDINYINYNTSILGSDDSYVKFLPTSTPAVHRQRPLPPSKPKVPERPARKPAEWQRQSAESSGAVAAAAATVDTHHTSHMHPGKFSRAQLSYTRCSEMK